MQGFVLKPCSTKKAHAKCAKRQRVNHNKVKDKISQLPDEILVTTLSRLTMKEAARTSILSHRWRKLWTFIPTLTFDHSEVLPCLDKKCRAGNDPILIKARARYVEWVNLVLRFYRGSHVPLDEFQVRFDLDADYTNDIDNWVKFAIEKNVKSLTMHFAKSLESVRWKKVYAFPQICDRLDNFISLQKLSLEYVNISQNVIEHLISSCPGLEELAIKQSQYLVHLNIVGESLPLKHLKIVYCDKLKSLCLFAANLSSFKYVGQKIDISYANVPKLVDLSVGGFYLDHFIYNFPRFSDYAIRLETLTLIVLYFKSNIAFPEHLGLPYLKILKLDVCIPNDRSLLLFSSLINAAPSLCKVVLELDCLRSLGKKTELQKAAKYPHPCLKEVQIDGFVGRMIDLEFAKNLLENAIVLEKVILDLIGADMKALDTQPSPQLRKRAMEQAMLLKSEFSLGDKLVLRNF